MKFFLYFFCLSFFSPFFFSGCVSNTQKNIADILNPAQIPFATQDTKTDFLVYDIASLDPFIDTGLGWSPLLLPVRANTVLDEADFLTGFWQTNPRAALGVPAPGTCSLIENKRERNKPKATKQRTVFFSSPQATSARALFIILDADSGDEAAIARLDHNGQAKCSLPEKDYIISTDFGDLRKEVNLDAKSDRLDVIFFEKGTLRFVPSQGTGLQQGDVIRIGRRLSRQNFLDLKNMLLLNDYRISGEFSGQDLYQKSNLQSQILGADEFLRPSLLAGKEPFELNLATSHYVVAVLRNQALVCFKSFDLQAKETLTVDCPKQQPGQAEHNFDESADPVNFIDATQYPPFFLQSQQFQEWLFSHRATFPLLTSKTALLLHDRMHSVSRLYPIEKDFFSLSPSWTPHSFTVFPTSTTHIPLGVVSERDLVSGVVPFFVFTRLTSAARSSRFLLHSEEQVSNGATLNWLEPSPSALSAGGISGYSQQRFRLVLVVPPWNTTNIVEAWIDGHFYRRWVFERGDLTQTKTVNIDLDTTSPDHFLIRFVAWGEDILPDLLTGIPDALPFVVTKNYCIDVGVSGLCGSKEGF